MCIRCYFMFLFLFFNLFASENTTKNKMNLNQIDQQIDEKISLVQKYQRKFDLLNTELKTLNRIQYKNLKKNYTDIINGKYLEINALHILIEKHSAEIRFLEKKKNYLSRL